MSEATRSPRNTLVPPAPERTGGIAAAAIERPLYVWILAAACLFGGIWGIDTVGRLEDPRFPIKNAFIITAYPGASAFEVEQEVTDRIEAALQELPYIDEMTSKSVPGRSEVLVALLQEYGHEETPQIWDELRRRIGEAAMQLPPGAMTPLVEDDFGDVYGLLYAVRAPDYSPAEIRDMSRLITSRLKLIPGVAKVASAGEPVEAVHVELDHARLTGLGVPLDIVFRSIGAHNQISDAGSVVHGARRLRVAPELAYDSLQAIEDLPIGRPGTTEFVRLGDVASIHRGPVEETPHIITRKGEPVFTVGVSVVHHENVVDVGYAVDAGLATLTSELPLGVTIEPIVRQHVVVERAISAFMTNLALSVLTVVGALCLFMGWRAGAVVGSVLLLTILGTMGLLALAGIELQRISLGALMIAMGMLVDNAIVVAEGMVVGVTRGLPAKDAAAHAVQRTQFPLLGATVIGILAFAPIALSDDNAGHFLVSLFQVVAISLLLSWVLAITVVPLLGSRLLRPPDTPREDVHRGLGYRLYGALIGFGLRRAWLMTLLIAAVTLACVWSFTFIKQGLYPPAGSPLFYVDVYLPQGTDVHTTAREIVVAQDAIAALDGVEEITVFIGRGAPRFAATVQPEQPNPAFAQLLVRVVDAARVTELRRAAVDALEGILIDAEKQVWGIQFSPTGKLKVEARFSGPDAATLRMLADQTLAVYLEHDLLDRRTDWRQRELNIVPRVDDVAARMAGLTRADVYGSLAYATRGVTIGTFRERDKLLPIVARAPALERTELVELADRLVWSPAERVHVPLSRVVTAFDLTAEDTIIRRRDRERTITAQANVPDGYNFAQTFEQFRGQVEAIPLPPGYRLEWGGEHEANLENRAELIGKLPLTFGSMFLVTVLLFGRLRQPIVIWLTAPLIVCGVVISLVLTNLTFTFPAFLGFLSLSGMLIKNCIILLDEIDKRLAEGADSLDTVAAASISRLRPVMLAAGTTIAGMSPLVTDAFFREMAVCIMGGLAFSTLLTLIAVPVFYRLLLGRRLATA